MVGGGSTAAGRVSRQFGQLEARGERVPVLQASDEVLRSVKITIW